MDSGKYLERYGNLIVIGRIGQKVCEYYDFAQLVEIETTKRVDWRRNLLWCGRSMTIAACNKIGWRLSMIGGTLEEFHLANILGTLVERDDCIGLRTNEGDECVEERGGKIH